MKASFNPFSLPKLSVLVTSMMLSGCNYALFDPKGIIGVQIKELILTALVLMLIVVIPVILMTVYFAYRFRASNHNEKYIPDWAHSNKIEFVVWTVPIIIIIILATITWRSTHRLEPSKPFSGMTEPLTIEVVAMDWKWLFIYPKQGVALINYVAFPKDRMVLFKLTSDNIMNSFFIPRLGSQLYAMPGMVTRLHLMASDAGKYPGVAISYSGAGFSDMKFTANALESQKEFDQWIAEIQSSPDHLNDFNDYLALAEPSINVPVTYYSHIPEGLFASVVTQYEGSMNHAYGEPMDSMDEHQHTDMHGMDADEGQ